MGVIEASDRAGRWSREFWKDNKRRVGEVCEECRNEVDDKSSSIRKEKK